MEIKLAELIGDRLLALDDGDKLYQKVFPAFIEKTPVKLDFEGVKSVFSPFMKEFFGKLLDHFEKERVMEQLVYQNITPELLKSMNDYLDYLDKQDNRESSIQTMEEWFEEDELGDI